MRDCSNVVVYDLGGGTLDVTVLEMFEGVMEVRASSGNNKLGGKDFDQAVMDYIADKLTHRQRASAKNDMSAMARLKKEAELCKIALSAEPQYTISLPFFANVDGKPISVDETITVQKLNELIAPKIDSTAEQLTTALEDAKMTVGDIDLILLVGGSTRIPYVYDFISKYFGKEPQKLLDPDLAVIQGAAIQAGILDNQFADNEIVLTDVCPYTLGTAVLKRWSMSEIFGFDDMEFDPIIPRNVTIPTTVEKVYCTVANNQSRVKVDVYQGEYSDPKRNNFLNEFLLDGVPPAPAGEESIKISFSYDVNGILDVEAEIVSTGKKASITIATQDQKMIEETDVSDWKSAPNASKVSAVVRRAERVLRRFENENFYDGELFDIVRELKEALVKDSPMEEIEELKDELVEYLLDLEEDKKDD
jgi:molecular chaperone DnaK